MSDNQNTPDTLAAEATEFRIQDHDLLIPLDPVAAAVHGVQMVYAHSLGQEMPEYIDMSSEIRESVRQGIQGVLNGNTPEQSHASWMAHRLANGWTYGEVKDPVAKTHPDLRPFAELPKKESFKDDLFIATARAVIAGFREGVMHGKYPLGVMDDPAVSDENTELQKIALEHYGLHLTVQQIHVLGGVLRDLSAQKGDGGALGPDDFEALFADLRIRVQ